MMIIIIYEMIVLYVHFDAHWLPIVCIPFIVLSLSLLLFLPSVPNELIINYNLLLM